MINSSRLETNLIHVARRYAPTLIPAGWQKPSDYTGALPDLARALATYNVLVLAGDVPATAIKAWTDGYSDFYALLAGALFPSYTRVSAFYLDQAAPPLVALYGECTPVITVLAGFVAPYVVARQGTRPLEVEVLGMMDMILEELEATDLPRGDYRRLRDSGAAYLRALLEGAGRQFPLTPATRPIFAEMTAAANVPAQPAPPPPDDLPESASAAPPPIPELDAGAAYSATAVNAARSSSSAARRAADRTGARTAQIRPGRCADLLQPRATRYQQSAAAGSPAATPLSK